MANEYFYDSGDTRYFKSIATTTIATTTGQAFSSTSAHGALYHSAQIKTSSLLTSTVLLEVELQGSLDETTPTNWFEMNKLTITAASTKLISAVEACKWVRVNVTSANTTGAAAEVEPIMFGAGVTQFRR